MQLTTVARRIAPLAPLLRCPLCGQSLHLEGDRSLFCEARHCFDLSARGYVNLAPGHAQAQEKYDAALFESRARIFADGFYAPVAQALYDAVAGAAGEVPAVIADVGCGEGYYTRALSQRLPHATLLGVDLSRDAVVAAARQAPALPWLVGDLTRLPLADGAVTALLNVLTPADYREFTRVLSPEGLLYKIVPAGDYLAQIRHSLSGLLRGGDFSNARVIDHLQAHADVLRRTAIRETFPVTPAQAADFLRMTPLTFGLPQAVLAQVDLREITVAVELLVCRMRRD